MPRSYFARSQSRSDWQTAGMTEKAESAAARFGLTSLELQEGKVPCQWRSCFGNSYAVVKIADVAALAKRLKAEKEAKLEASLVEKHGKEGLAKMREEKRKTAEATREAEKKEAARKLRVTKLKGDLTFFQEVEAKLLCLGGTLPDYKGEEPQLGKTKSKSTFKLRSTGMSALDGKEIQVGRRKFYRAKDLVDAALSETGRSYSGAMKLELSALDSLEALQVYAYVLRAELEITLAEMEQASIDEAQEQAKETMAENLANAEDLYEKAADAAQKAKKAVEQARKGAENFQEFLEQFDLKRTPWKTKKGKKRSASGKGSKRKKAKLESDSEELSESEEFEEDSESE